MKSLLRKVLSFALAFFLVISFIPNEIKAAEKKNYLALGDSISTGYGLSQNGFVNQIADKYGYNLTNSAADGETSQSLLYNLNSGSLKSDIENADVITLTVGGNDLMNALYDFLAEKYNASAQKDYDGEKIKEILMNNEDGEYSAVITTAILNINDFLSSNYATDAISNFENNLNDIISYIETNNPDAWVIITTQYNPYKFLSKQGQGTNMEDTLNLINTTFEQGVQNLNQIIKNVNTNSSTFIIADVYERFNDAKENPCNATYDNTYKLNLDFHPNEYGHGLIADMVSGKIDELQYAIDQEEALNLLNPTFIKIREMNELKTTSISKVKTKEQAKTWAENLIKPVLPDGMSVKVTIENFTPAKEGTKDNVKGTQGSFKLTAVLEYNGFKSEMIEIDTTIKTTAYSNTDDNKQQTDDKNQTSNTSNKEINTPNTSDQNNITTYVLILIISGISLAAVMTTLRKRYH